MNEPALVAPGDVVDAGRFHRAIRAIDAANAADPNVVVRDGRAWPKELLHAQLMTEWLVGLDPDAGELAHLAARAHHFRRWTRPRTDYPDGRAGYLRWRAAAARAHADEVGRLLVDEGYSAPEVQRVGAIVRKDGLTTDPVVQTHEDARCVVFLETQLVELADRLGEDQIVSILARTISKMSGAGLAAAGSLELDGRATAVLAKAVTTASDEGRSAR